MLFNSLPFILFFVLFLPLFYLFSGKIRLCICVLASYFFYAWWDWRFLSLIIISTVVDYIAGLYLEKGSKENNRKFILAISVIVNLTILGFFKYFNFFIDSVIKIGSLFNVDVASPALNVILPVGISFYTFQSMSYTIDVYRKKSQVEHSFVKFAAYISLFPQLVAGPIVRASHLLPQMAINHKFNIHRLARGIELIVWGYFLKLCVADRLASLVDPVYNNPLNFGGAAHVLATFSFSFQIYGDFCGYSLIAIGLGKILGYDFGINFCRPYFAISFSDFWSRWHISLSSWLRDYLYIPLGGNELGIYKTLRNLLIVMFLGGLWHGAAWTFVIWGLLHGIYLIIQNLVSKINYLNKQQFVNNKLIIFIKIILVFLCVNIAWVFFRASTISDAFLILKKIITFDNYFQAINYNLFALVVSFMMVSIVIFVDLINEYLDTRRIYHNRVMLRASSIITLLWVITFFGVFEGTTFIYFQF